MSTLRTSPPVCSRKMLSCLEEPTKNVFLNASRAGAGAVGLTSAPAVPEPIFEPRAQAAGPSLTSVDSEHVLKPFVFSLIVFGKKISIVDAVVPDPGALTML